MGTVCAKRKKEAIGAHLGKAPPEYASQFQSGKTLAFGAKAKQSIAVLVFAEVVELASLAPGRDGRTTAFARIGDNLVKEELIRHGLVWEFPSQPSGYSKVKKERQSARTPCLHM